MKILVFGADGMLGSDIVKTLKSDFEIVESFEKDLDITQKRSVKNIILSEKPRWVINAAAYANVDGCESNKETAFLVNADAVGYISEACLKSAANLIHFSTDYVFDGTKETPYSEYDRTNPINVYGRSKLMGEDKIKSFIDNYYIVRTQWLFGKNGKNFADTICKYLAEKKELKVVDDQEGSPTYTKDLAGAIKTLVLSRAPFGTYNLRNENFCNWYEYAHEIARLKHYKEDLIKPVGTKDFPRPAKRPNNSKLDMNKFYKEVNYKMRSWQKALGDYLSSQ